ncbi:hypothetical protein Sjap_017517 [Stephania japonica]|uniref:Tail-anchored protein insertion receptor WRB n=1 Tax=Stephania japonica TaxID=461633 RepID=A0AAP0I6B2_9MAGN
MLFIIHASELASPNLYPRHNHDIKNFVLPIACGSPSTFAEASKLRRLAAAKEKELQKGQELHNKEKTLSYDQYLQYLKVFKVVVYLLLILWFWKEPVATVSQQLLKPFGNALCWGPTDYLNDHVPVGIIAWLVISNRVSKFICQKLSKRLKH